MSYNHQAFVKGMQHSNATVVDLGDDLVMVIKETEAYDADYSYLGEWTNQVCEGVINRRWGALYGAYHDEVYRMPMGMATGAACEQELLKQAEKDGWSWSDEHTVTDFSTETEDDIDGNEVEYMVLGIEGYKILARVAGRFVDRNSYEYFQPMHTSGNPPYDAEQIKYAMQDWKRMESMNDDEWSLADYVATLYYRGVEVAENIYQYENDMPTKEIVGCVLYDYDLDISKVMDEIEELEMELDVLRAFNPGIFGRAQDAYKKGGLSEEQPS